MRKASLLHAREEGVARSGSSVCVHGVVVMPAEAAMPYVHGERHVICLYDATNSLSHPT